MTMGLRPSQASSLVLLCGWVLAFFGYLGWKPDFAYNAQRYFEILFVGILLCVGLSLHVRFLWGRLWGALSLTLVATMLVVISLAENRWLAIREGGQYLALFMAIIAAAKARHHAGAAVFDRAAYIGLSLFSLGCALIALEGLILSLSIGKLDQRIVFGAFVNVRTFAELYFLSLLVLPAAAMKLESSGWRYVSIFAGILGWGFLLFSGTRSALVVLPFALMVLIAVAGRPAFGWLKALTTQLVGGLVFFAALRIGVGLASGGSAEVEDGMSLARTSTGGRLELWSDAWGHFLQSPWFGDGPGSFACFTDELVATPHNLFFQLLAEWGGVMTLLCLSLALLLFHVLVRYLRANHQLRSSPVHLSLFSTLVAVVAASMMEGMIIGPLQQMLVVLIFGWALHAFGPERFVGTGGRFSCWYRLSSAIVLIAGFSVVLWGVKKDLALQTDLLVSPEGVVNLSYGPRFWADGHDHCVDWHARYRRAN